MSNRSGQIMVFAFLSCHVCLEVGSKPTSIASSPIQPAKSPYVHLSQPRSLECRRIRWRVWMPASSIGPIRP
jgi:hypothetical protein